MKDCLCVGNQTQFLNCVSLYLFVRGQEEHKFDMCKPGCCLLAKYEGRTSKKNTPTVGTNHDPSDNLVMPNIRDDVFVLSSLWRTNVLNLKFWSKAGDRRFLRFLPRGWFWPRSASCRALWQSTQHVALSIAAQLLNSEAMPLNAPRCILSPSIRECGQCILFSQGFSWVVLFSNSVLEISWICSLCCWSLVACDRGWR